MVPRWSRRTVVAACIALAACGAQAPAVAPTQATPPVAEPVVRNVILFIGDGMGPAQIGLLQAYARYAPSSPFDGPTSFERLADAGTLGLSSTEPHGGLVVDSACSATQLATGVSAPSEALAVDPDGRPVATVLEHARATGRAVGLVSDTRITHATPAAFVAHLPHRSDEPAVAAQMIESGADVLLSGGLRSFVPHAVADEGPVRDAWVARLDGAYAPRSDRPDDRDLVAEAEAAGFHVVFDRAQLDTAAGRPGPLLGLFAASGMMDAIALEAALDDPTRREPTLAEMTEAALAVLERDEDGFFLMVEAGQIDWAGHANDAGWLLHEMVRAEETVGVLLAYAQAHPDTLLVVTADHETGGFGFSYSGASLPAPQRIEGGVFDATPYAPNFNFGSAETLDLLAGQRQALEALLSRLSAEAATDADVALALSEALGLAIDPGAAARIMAEAPNRWQVDGHPYLGAESTPDICDFGAFYVYPTSSRSALVARATAAETGVVWSTGTHTATPVPVFAVGPASSTAHFAGMTDHVRIGQALIEVVDAPVR